MRLFTQIIFAAVITLLAFSVITYTACKQDKCKGIACINGGACQDGTCICPSGYSGTHCETVANPCANIVCINGGSCSGGTCSCPVGYTGTYCQSEIRLSYENTYQGNGTDDAGGTYNNWELIYSIDGTNATSMQLVLADENGVTQLTLTMHLTSNTVYSVVSQTNGSFTYTGSGTINATTATLTLNEHDNSTGNTVVYTFTNMHKI